MLPEVSTSTASRGRTIITFWISRDGLSSIIRTSAYAPKRKTVSPRRARRDVRGARSSHCRTSSATKASATTTTTTAGNVASQVTLLLKVPAWVCHISGEKGQMVIEVSCRLGFVADGDDGPLV